MSAGSRSEGETFKAGDELLEIETTKITNVFEAPRGWRVAPDCGAGGRHPADRRPARGGRSGTVPDGEIDAFVAGFAPPEPSAEAETASEALRREKSKPAESGCATSKWAPAKGLPWC